MQLLYGMSSRHETVSYKLEEKLGGVLIVLLHIISNDEKLKSLIPETQLFIEINIIESFMLRTNDISD